MDPTDPTAVALAVAEALRSEAVEHALYGGLLLAAYGTARETKDVDLAVVRGNAAATASLLDRHLGLHTAVAFDQRRFGGLAIGRITLIEDEELNTLDLVEPLDPAYAARALSRALWSTLRGQAIRVLTPEDFVLFKLLSTRELDLVDAGSVLSRLAQELDLAQVESEVDALEESVAEHPIRARWERVREGL